jgi:predicted DNA-binding transcriptional regulator
MNKEKQTGLKWSELNTNNRPLSEIQLAIMEFVAENDAVFLREIGDQFGISPPTVHNHVTRLKRKGLLKRVEIKPGTTFVPSELVNRIAELHKSKKYPAGNLKLYHWVALADGVTKDTDFEAAIDEN